MNISDICQHFNEKHIKKYSFAKDIISIKFVWNAYNEYLPQKDDESKEEFRRRLQSYNSYIPFIDFAVNITNTSVKIDIYFEYYRINELPYCMITDYKVSYDHIITPNDIKLMSLIIDEISNIVDVTDLSFSFIIDKINNILSNGRLEYSVKSKYKGHKLGYGYIMIDDREEQTVEDILADSRKSLTSILNDLDCL